jgi:hypothetical protein
MSAQRHPDRHPRMAYASFPVSFPIRQLLLSIELALLPSDNLGSCQEGIGSSRNPVHQIAI